MANKRCIYPDCGEPAAEGSNYCEDHIEKMKDGAKGAENTIHKLEVPRFLRGKLKLD